MPLNAKQLQHLEKRLHEERERLLGQLQEFTDEERSEDIQSLADDASKVPQHPLDLGTDVASEELEASIATRRSAEIAEIDAALERMATSPETFGRDEQSDEEIPFERLDLIPYARTNVA